MLHIIDNNETGSDHTIWFVESELPSEDIVRVLARLHPRYSVVGTADGHFWIAPEARSYLSDVLWIHKLPDPNVGGVIVWREADLIPTADLERMLMQQPMGFPSRETVVKYIVGRIKSEKSGR